MADTERVIEYLAGIAGLGRLVTYTECMGALAIADRGTLYGLLGEVQRIQSRITCDLSALVVSARTRRPGRGWERGATEGWERAVARCYRVYAAGGAEAAVPPGRAEARPAPAHGLPYSPGNAGDLLKHGWLAAVAPWLLARSPAVFRYADSFAGEWDYELHPTVTARATRLEGTPLAHYSRAAWNGGRYLGSTGVVGAVTSQGQGPAEIWVGDRDPTRVSRLVAEHGCRRLPEWTDGYAVVEGDANYDLIFLDPFAGFLDSAPDLLPRIVARSLVSSILLFVLAESRASPTYRRYRDVLREQCRAQAATAVVGGIPALAHTPVQGESRYDSEIVLIPRRGLAGSVTDQLLPQLAACSVRTAMALGDAVEARLWVTGW
jgi:hypothetical protein